MKQATFLFLFMMVRTIVPAQGLVPRDLPEPSGDFGIGHQHFEWRDSSRQEILANNSQFRVVVADIWYPAEKAKQPAVQYLDTLPVYIAFGSKGLTSLLGAGAAARIRAGSIHTHAVENAPFNRGIAQAPVILFSHGMGMITQLYTAQVEDLVSHGYIVVALTHAYDAWLLGLQDGGTIRFETTQRAAAGNTEEAHIAYENKRLEWWAGDIRFAIDKLAELNQMNTGYPFTGHFNLLRIGAMGHSSGGRAAARACQLDQRIKSCADQDGVAMMLPFYISQNGKGMKQPFLLFERDRNLPPTDAELQSMKMTRQYADSLIKILRGNRDAALSATGGSYRVLLNFDKSTHMSFSDLPVLQAKDSTECVAAYQILQVTCRYTREFFDKTLLGAKHPCTMML